MKKNEIPQDLEVDTLIIGSGVAGLMLAIKLAEQKQVLVLAKGSITENNTYYAQGGIASVLSAEDSFAEHIQDTLNAGAGLCHEDAVKAIIYAGPKAIQDLAELGVQFSKKELSKDDELHLTREGGHSQRRVAHVQDLTGQAIMEALVAKIRTQKNIRMLEQQFVIDLATSDKCNPSFKENSCLGAYVLDLPSQQIYRVRSKQTVLCTGGHGRIYLYTTNPILATGDGIAMGWRAGCKLANLEFMQFHPTCLFHPKEKTFLISEAVRGEGAILQTKSGEAFMEKYHPLGSLAPRDIVARAMDTELKKSGDACIYLDATVLGAERIRSHFPTIYQTCLQLGLDITRERIPVVPAAHYSCGGIIIDEVGQTNVKNLFALGEVACSGLHGANRLASNSLLEACVLADRAAQFMLRREVSATFFESIPPWNKGKALPQDEQVILNHAWDEIRRLMWNYVGIVRSDARLKKALKRIVTIMQELDDYYWDYEVNYNLLEVRNLAQVAWLTVRSAMSRKESRGIHYNVDHPDVGGRGKDTII